MVSFLLILTLIFISGASDSRQTVPAKEVLAEIDGHKTVSYKSVIIAGDLILDGASSGSIVYPITVVDCDIEGDVRFDNSVLARPINFEKTRFNGSVSFDGTRFLGCANFSQCEFRRSASFRGAMFRGPTSFGRAIFRSFSTFREAVFDGTLADFHASDFKDYASFNFASFHVEKADFEGSKFEGDANFQQAEFKGRAVFLGSAFRGLADFDRSRFNTTSEFLGARFYDELHLNGVDYNVFDITWDSIRHRLVCDEPGYIALVVNFKKLGRFDEADNCYYQYREWMRINRPLQDWAGTIWDLLAWVSCGYGVRWTHTLLSAIFILLLFALYYGISESRRTLRELLPGEGSVKITYKGLKRELHSTVLLSTICLLSLPWEMYPYGHVAYTRFVKRHFFAVILERILGWALMLLLIGVITRMFVRY